MNNHLKTPVVFPAFHGRIRAEGAAVAEATRRDPVCRDAGVYQSILNDRRPVP